MPLFGLLSPPSNPFFPPSFPYALYTDPIPTLLSSIYSFLSSLRGYPLLLPSSSSLSTSSSASSSRSSSPRLKVVCLSDTHTRTHLPTPDGDLLIHAGDMGSAGTAAEIQSTIDWLSELPHRHKVIIAGNHDGYLDPRSRAEADKTKTLDWKGIHYLQHSSVTLTFPSTSAPEKATPTSASVSPVSQTRTLTVYGAPQIPACGGADFAFQYPRGEDAWSDTLPNAIDILVTHTPPKWHVDLAHGMGCEHLLREIWRVKPRIHVCGHVHAGRGVEALWWDAGQAAFERICERGRSWWALLDVRVWIDVVRVLGWGVVGLVWRRLWGVEEEGTLLVNAAMAHWEPGRMRDGVEAIVVEI